VTNLERTNARTLRPEDVGGPADLVVVDASFIGLGKLAEAIARCVRPGGRVLALVKPQFEVGRGGVGKGGIVRDPALQRDALAGLVDFAAAAGHAVRGWCESPITGADGNREFFLHIGKGGAGDRSAEIRAAVAAWRPDGA
jgi:23S rRNA (cytidine1920-2'-O)/16S rRNA (cytidine1409-2'-O)-methyltransferase